MSEKKQSTEATIAELFAKNRNWANAILKEDETFFQRLSQQQNPDYLWIGCSDSRVPANEILGMLPGDVFVHRNVANVVVHTDLNCLSVMQFAVDVLKVRHIIVTGHYGCGGVKAAVERQKFGLIDNWLRHIQDVQQKHSSCLQSLEGGSALVDRMCELNVIEQVVNVSQSTVVQDAWARGQELSIHGFIYSVNDGLLRDLHMSASSSEELHTCYQVALAAVKERVERRCGELDSGC
ncbi:MAG: carbonate dehydratase [Gammaproteobacteria bacterium]|nr:carbonate dehydratase [Gammaproteobacteria bacterium]